MLDALHHVMPAYQNVRAFNELHKYKELQAARTGCKPAFNSFLRADEAAVFVGPEHVLS